MVGRTAHDDASLVGPTEVTADAYLHRISELRVSIWRERGGLAPDAFPTGRWHDEFDRLARHWVVTRDGRLVAAARLSLHERLEQVPEAFEYLAAGLELAGTIAAPARLVVSTSAAHHGLASRLVAVREEAAAAAGAAHGLCQASPAVCRLLLGRGWDRFGPAPRDPRFPEVTFQIMTCSYHAGRNS